MNSPSLIASWFFFFCFLESDVLAVFFLCLDSEMIASKTSTVDSWKTGIHQQITHFFLCVIFFFLFFSFSIISCSFLRIAFSSFYLHSISLCSAASMSRRRGKMGREEGEEEMKKGTEPRVVHHGSREQQSNTHTTHTFGRHFNTKHKHNQGVSIHTQQYRSRKH